MASTIARTANPVFTPATPAYLSTPLNGTYDAETLTCRYAPTLMTVDARLMTRLGAEAVPEAPAPASSARPASPPASGSHAVTDPDAAPETGETTEAETSDANEGTGAGTGTGAAPAPSEGQSDSPGGGGNAALSARRAAKQEHEERLEDAALAIPFVPRPLPDERRETSRLPAFLLDVEVTAAPFGETRALGAKPSSGKQDMPAYLQGYEAHFGGAVDRIGRNYTDVIAGAGALAQQMKIVQAQATTVVQRAMDEALDTVDRRLEIELKVLERGEDAALYRLALIANTARLLTRKAAQRALGTVASRKRKVESHLATASDQRDGIIATMNMRIDQIAMSGLDASASLAGLSADPSPARFPNAREPASAYAPAMENAMNEDLDPVVSHHANSRRADFGTARDLFGQNMMQALDGFNNSAAQAFAPFQSYVDMLGAAAPNQIRKLRENALKSIDRMERRATRSIRESRNMAELGLAERHGQSRKRLVEQGHGMAGAQNKAIQGAATSQLRGFAALAAAQAPTVSALRKRIAGQQAAGPEQFARFAISASQRTAEQSASIAGAKLDQAIARSRTLSSAMVQKAQTAANSEEQSARQAGDLLGSSAKQAGANMMQLALGQEQALRRAAEPVAKSIDSFRIPAEAQLTTMEAELLRLLGLASQQADAAWTGAEGPRTENPDPPPTPPEQPPAGTGANPSAFATLADERAAAPQDDPDITTMADRVGQTVSTDVQRRGDGLMPLMTVTGQSPKETLALLHGLTALRGQAVISYYNVETGGSLIDDIPLYMNVGNPVSGIDTRVDSILAALNYLNGNRAAGALLEVQAATEFWNDNEQAMSALEALSPADLQALRALDPDGTILDEVESDLGGNQGRAFNLLRTATSENAAEAIAGSRALRLEDRIGDDLSGHPERGADAAFDSMAGVANQIGTTRLEGANEYGLDSNFAVESREAREARQRTGWQDTVARLGNAGERRADGAAGGLAWLDSAVAQQRTYWEPEVNYWGLVVPGVPLVTVNVWQASARTEQRDLLHALAEFGPNDPRTRARQLAVEDTRPGGAKRERFERAWYDPRTNADMANPDDPNARMSHPRRPGDPPTDLERGLEDEAAMLRYYDEYRNGRPHDNPRPLSEIRNELGASLRAGSGDERLGRLLELQVTRGVNDPETAALAFEHAVDRAGTDEQLIKDTMRRMSPDQVREAVERYDATHTPGLYERLGLFNHEDDWFTELSGDDRQEIQVLAMGQPRNDRERAEVSRMSSRLQRNNSSWLSRNVLASAEYDRMGRSHDRLIRAMGVSDADFDAFGRLRAPNGTPVGNWDERGNFRPNGTTGAIAFATAIARNEAHAANYRTVTDNIANAVSMAIIITAAVISTFFTGGAAASLWIPALITLGGGVVAMGANWAIKGGRYGYEDMGRDFGMAVVQAATAGLASGMSIGITGGSAALRAASTAMRVSNAGFRSATLVEEAIIAGAAGAFGGAGNAMFDDQAWDNGEWLNGIGRGFAKGGAGGMMGGIATGVTTRAMGGLAGNIGRIRGAREATARGLTGTDASRLAMARAQAASQSVPVSLLGRSLGGGIGGAATRGVEIGYDRSQGRYRGSFATAMDEMAAAGLQNAGQGLLEGMVEHHYQDHAGADALRTRAFGTAVDPAAPAARTPRPADESAAPVARQPADPADAAAPAPARTAANDNAADTHVSGAPRSAITEGSALPGSLADESAQTTARFRAASDDDDGVMRSNFDDDTPTNPGVEPLRVRMTFAEHARGEGIPQLRGVQTVHDTVDLTPEMLRNAPTLPEESVIRATNPRDRAAAEANYRAMRDSDPHREVLLAFNYLTQEYAVVQGGSSSVRKPSGEGWFAERHSHPRTHLATDRDAILHALPSGRPGDVGTLIAEARRDAARPENGGVGLRVSKIDILHQDGSISETTFGVRYQGDQPEITVTFRNPATGQDESFGPVTSIADYNAQVLRLTGYDITARPVNVDDDSMTSARRARPVSADERETARFIAENARRAGNAPASTEAAAASHAAVKRLGLVGEPDSLARLTALINDPDLPPNVRSALAQATLDATRAELIRTGALAPGDDVMLLFRGVTQGRMADYDANGMDLSRLGRGGDEDAGRGLYGSQDFESAANYTGPRDDPGTVLPLIVRRSELGNVIDVRSGTPLGDRWLAFVRASNGKGRMPPGPGYDHLRGVLHPGTDMPITLVRDGRGTRFEQFLKSIADDPTLPDAVRAAARDPHITLMDLGGVASTGNDRGILTDQWAMHTQRIADLFNEAHGFPMPGRRSGGAGGGDDDVMHSALGPNGGSSSQLPLRAVSPQAQARLAADRAAEVTAMTSAHRDVQEVNAMQRALATVHPDNPHALIARNATDDDAGFAAQEALNDLSKAPSDARVVNIDIDAEARFGPPGNAAQERVIRRGGMDIRISRRAATAKNSVPHIEWEASIPPRRPGEPAVVYQFGNGELRAWRTVPTADEPAGRIVQESVVGPGRERAGFEDQKASHGEGEFAGSALERGHLHGAGLGVESPLGIGMVPREVNQEIQNRGIEGWMRKLRDQLPPGAEMIYRTEVSWQKGTGRHADISYEVDIVLNGERFPFAAFAIEIEGDPPGTPRAEREGTRSVVVNPIERVDTGNPAVNRYFDSLVEAADMSLVLHHGLPREADVSRANTRRALYSADPETVAAAATTNRALGAVRPEPRADFRIGPWRDRLDAVLSRDPVPRFVIVDTRELGLTETQLRRIDEAIRRLPRDQQRRVIRLLDRN